MTLIDLFSGLLELKIQASLWTTEKLRAGLMDLSYYDEVFSLTMTSFKNMGNIT